MTIRTPDFGSEPRIPPETLAAFMEGALTEEERAEVLRILASSEADLDILADAIAALAAVETEGGESEASPDPLGPQAAPEDAPVESQGPAPPQGRRRPWVLRPPVWLAAAAVVAFLWAAPALLRGPEQLRVDRWAQLEAVGGELRGVQTPPDLFSTAGRSSVRGGDGLLSDQARAYRTGATLATLAAAEFADQDPAGDEALGRITQLLDAVPGGALLATRLREVVARDRESSGGSVENEWDATAATLAEALPESDYFWLGLWVESVRIEAMARPWPAGEPGPDGRELEALGAAAIGAGDGALAARVEEARRLLDAGAPAPAVVDALEAISAEAWGG